MNGLVRLVPLDRERPTEHIVKPSNVGSVADTASAGDLVYIAPERADRDRLREQLDARLVRRGLMLRRESYGWFRLVADPRPTSPDQCTALWCGGTVANGYCRRCGTRG